MHEKSELVRSEYLLVLNHIVESFPTWQKVAGMQSLIVGGDEEASFFTNVLHIQQHRRARALRRLAEDAASLGSTNASRIFLPLLEHFVFDPAEGDSGRTLADQAVQSIGSLAQTLNKSAFRATFQRYVGQLKAQKGKEEDNMEKVILRLLGAMVDGLRNAAEASGTPLLSEAIIKEQLPPLLEYLHQKDDSTVDRRMPVAVTIVKLMKGLSEEEFAARLPAVLTDVSHVLRSRSQEVSLICCCYNIPR
jgi:U3 small nucleolar RNA-associated protein 20